MFLRSSVPLAALALLSTLSGCMAKPASVATASVRRPASDAVHRLDFVLTSTDDSKLAFTMTLPEGETGVMTVGKNVVLSSATSSSTGVQRHDVGTRVRARYEMKGDDLLLAVDIEATSAKPPNVQKYTTVTRALVAPGRSAVVAQLESDAERLSMTVTPTKVR